LREAQAAEASRNAALRDANNRLVDTLDELRSAQRQLVQTEKLASLGRVTAGIAHEIRNPLNFVVGFSGLAFDLVAELSETFERYPVPDTAAADATAETLSLLRANLARVDEHARRANDIVTSMLEHVRTVGGPRGQVAVADLVDATLEALRDDAPAGLRLVVDDASDGAEVVAVAGSLRRVFANLFANAFAALADRAAAEPVGSDWTPTLTVALRVLPGDPPEDLSGAGPAVEVSVTDNGPGLSPAARGRVFEPFFTTRAAGQGTGLGLSLAYDIVTQGHSGTLETRDTPGDGATFVVTLPM
ncbi:MAG TPA: ATP-binding protein, partial [Rubricoccaceae bacterium]